MNYEEKKKYWYSYLYNARREGYFEDLGFFSKDMIISFEKQEPQIRKILKEVIIEFYNDFDEELSLEELKNIL